MDKSGLVNICCIDLGRNYCYSCSKQFSNFDSFSSHHQTSQTGCQTRRRKSTRRENRPHQDFLDAGRKSTNIFCNSHELALTPNNEHSENVIKLDLPDLTLSKSVVFQHPQQNCVNPEEQQQDDDGCFESECQIRVQCLECNQIFHDLKTLSIHLRRRKKIKSTHTQPPNPPQPPPDNVNLLLVPSQSTDSQRTLSIFLLKPITTTIQEQSPIVVPSSTNDDDDDFKNESSPPPPSPPLSNINDDDDDPMYDPKADSSSDSEEEQDPNSSSSIPQFQNPKKNLTTLQILELPKRKRANFPCSCGKSFVMKRTRDKHATKRNHYYNKEDEGELQKCRLCPSTFPTLLLVRKHMEETHPGQRIFLCSIQPDCKSYWDPTYLRRHVFREHGIQEEYICTKCSATFLQAGKYRHHLKLHKDEEREKNKKTRPPPPPPPSFECRLCPPQTVPFKTRKLLREHFKNGHPGKKPWKCPHENCDKSFWTMMNITIHIVRVHQSSSSLPYKCSQCDKSFIAQSLLDDHTRMHTGEQPFQCPSCGLRFNSNKNCNQHMKKHVDKFQCHLCPKVFNMKGNLQRHLDVHNNVKNYLCTICPEAYSQNVHLQTHMATAHGQDDPFQCSIPGCIQTFRGPGQLKRHMYSQHVGQVYQGRVIEPTDIGKLPNNNNQKPRIQGPVQCQQCGKEFLGSHRLNQHISIIHSKGQCQCEQCGKYLAPQNYKKHMKLHEKFPPGTVFRCKICDKDFSDQRFLTRHINYRHAK